MRLEYDSQVDILYIRLKDDPIVESEHLEDKGIVLDYNEKDEVVGIEIFDWSERQKSGQRIESKLTDRGIFL